MAGCVLGSKLAEDLKKKINWIFGICSFGMGINSVILMKNMPAVIFSVIVGTLLGLLIHLGAGIEKASEKLLRALLKDAEPDQKDLMLTAVVLFCASGTGIYGALDSGMTGSHSILITKAVLDFFHSNDFCMSVGQGNVPDQFPPVCDTYGIVSGGEGNSAADHRYNDPGF